MEYLIYINAADEARIPEMIEGLHEQGVLEEGSDITVRADPSLTSAADQTHIRVEHIFRDGANGRGPVDIPPEKYTVNFLK